MKVPFNPNPAMSMKLLLGGAIAGIIIAGVGLLDSKRVLPSYAVARVNHVLISRDYYEQVLLRLQTEKREALNATDRQYVLRRLIDEELMVQQGIELGFLRQDDAVRTKIMQAVTASIIADSDMDLPGRAELERFYQTNSAFFTQPTSLQVKQIFFHTAPDGESAKRKAIRASKELESGLEFEAVKAEFGDPITADIPNRLLLLPKLREYIGSTLLDAALGLKAGQSSETINTGSGIFILKLINRQDAQAPDFESIRALVQHEWLRRHEEENFRLYIQWLRDKAELITGDIAA